MVEGGWSREIMASYRSQSKILKAEGLKQAQRSMKNNQRCFTDVKYHGVFRELKAVLNCCILKHVWRMARHEAGGDKRSRWTSRLSRGVWFYPVGKHSSCKCLTGRCGHNCVHKRLCLQHRRWTWEGVDPGTGKPVNVQVRDHETRKGGLIREG